MKKIWIGFLALFCFSCSQGIQPQVTPTSDILEEGQNSTPEVIPSKTPPSQMTTTLMPTDFTQDVYEPITCSRYSEAELSRNWITNDECEQSLVRIISSYVGYIVLENTCGDQIIIIDRLLKEWDTLYIDNVKRNVSEKWQIVSVTDKEIYLAVQNEQTPFMIRVIDYTGELITEFQLEGMDDPYLTEVFMNPDDFMYDPVSGEFYFFRPNGEISIFFENAPPLRNYRPKLYDFKQEGSIGWDLSFYLVVEFYDEKLQEMSIALLSFGNTMNRSARFPPTAKMNMLQQEYIDQQYDFLGVTENQSAFFLGNEEGMPFLMVVNPISETNNKYTLFSDDDNKVNAESLTTILGPLELIRYDESNLSAFYTCKLPQKYR